MSNMDEDDKLTIVGPEPSRKKGLFKPGSVNIESLLLMAKYDASFREKLLTDRDSALADCDIPLSDTEKFILKAIDNKQLSHTIDTFEIKGITKKSLPNWKMAAAVVMLVSTLLLSSNKCYSDNVTKGAEPDPSTNTLDNGDIIDETSDYDDTITRGAYIDDTITKGAYIDEDLKFDE